MHLIVILCEQGNRRHETPPPIWCCTWWVTEWVGLFRITYSCLSCAGVMSSAKRIATPPEEDRATAIADIGYMVNAIVFRHMVPEIGLCPIISQGLHVKTLSYFIIRVRTYIRWDRQTDRQARSSQYSARPVPYGKRELKWTQKTL